jgi:hypothetical protein
MVMVHNRNDCVAASSLLARTYTPMTGAFGSIPIPKPVVFVPMELFDTLLNMYLVMCRVVVNISRVHAGDQRNRASKEWGIGAHQGEEDTP